MKLSNQVCSLEQAKRLKELGVIQESLFSWCGDETPRLMDNGKDPATVGGWVFVDFTKPVNNQHSDYRDDVPSAKPFAAAFSVAEIHQMLPDHYPSWRFQKEGKVYWIATIIGQPEGYERDKEDVMDIRTVCAFDRYGKTQAEALAALLISLLETGAETPEKVNNRLTL